MSAETLAVANAYPGIVSPRFSLGTSYQGRELWAVKVSDNVATRRGRARGAVHRRPARARAPDDRDGALPAQRVARRSTRTTRGSRSSSTRARSGSSSTSTPTAPSTTSPPAPTARGARTASPTPARASVGTDLNRNWSWQWGCCGGSSGTFSSETYRGPSAFSAPETQRVRDFVNSRVIGGMQQIKAAIDFHTYSELILWPYGYTTADTAAGLTARRPQRARDARPEHGGDQRLHARAVLRPLHRRRHDQRLAVGQPTRSSTTRSRCTRGRRTPASIRPTR